MIYNIQALRAVAALLVLFVHLDGILAPLGIRHDDLQVGTTGVDLFFVISGFVMVHTVMRRPLSGGAFMFNRLLRVAPLYWLLTLLTFAVALFAPHLMQATSSNPVELVKSLLFVPFTKANGLDQPVLYVGWTLNYEMFFYALFALALRPARGAIGPVVALTSAAILLMIALGGLVGVRPGLPYFYMYPITLEFVFGMLIALAGPRLTQMSRGPALAFVALGMVAMVAMPVAFHYNPRWLLAGVPAAIVLIGALSLERGGMRSDGRVVQLLGGASYALYLTHPFVFRIVGKLAGVVRPVTAVAIAVAAIVLAHAVAIVVHLRVENSLNDRVRRLSGHRPAVARVGEAEALAGGDKPLPGR